MSARVMKGLPISGHVAALQALRGWDGLQRLSLLLAQRRTRPNFFSIFARRIVRSEVVHSDVLGWLLDPLQWHGLDDRFVVLLTREVFSRSGRDIDGSLEIDSVGREFSTGQGSVDLLIEGRLNGTRFVIGVENKIDAEESEEQLLKYGAALIASCSGRQVLLAFLTPDGARPDPMPKGGCACIDYRTIAQLLADAIRTTPIEVRGGMGCQLAQHYQETLRTHVIMESDLEIEAVFRELYEDHKDAWRVIRRHMATERDELHEAFGMAACRRFKTEWGGEWQFSLRSDAFACVYRPSWRKLAKRDLGSIIGLEAAPEFNRIAAGAHLRLVAEPFDSEGSTGYRYTVRLKVDGRVSRDPLRAIRTNLRAKGLRVPNRSQFTVTLKSKSKLPSVIESPDRVLDWLMSVTKVKGAVKAIDSAMGTRR